MTYAVDIVGRALRVLRVVDPDEAIEDRKFETGLLALNSMMAAWEGVGRSLGWSPLANPKDIMPTPPEHDETIVFNLACKLRPEYGTTLDPDVIDFAQSGLAQIRASIASTEFVRLELDLPRAESDHCCDTSRAFYRGW